MGALALKQEIKLLFLIEEGKCLYNMNDISLILFFVSIEIFGKSVIRLINFEISICTAE